VLKFCHRGKRRQKGNNKARNSARKWSGNIARPRVMTLFGDENNSQRRARRKKQAKKHRRDGLRRKHSLGGQLPKKLRTYSSNDAILEMNTGRGNRGIMKRRFRRLKHQAKKSETSEFPVRVNCKVNDHVGRKHWRKGKK